MKMTDNIIYQGKVVTLVKEAVQLPNNCQCNLEIIKHPGGAAVVALNGQQQVCLLKQYRHAAQGWRTSQPLAKFRLYPYFTGRYDRNYPFIFCDWACFN